MMCRVLAPMNHHSMLGRVRPATAYLKYNVINAWCVSASNLQEFASIMKREKSPTGVYIFYASNATHVVGSRW